MPTLAKLVSEVKNPITLLAFGILCILTLIKRPHGAKQITQRVLLLGLGTIFLLALAPTITSFFSLKNDLIYRVRVFTLDSRHLPISGAQVRVNSLAETHTTTDGSCELVVPKATLNVDHRITIFADKNDEHGSEALSLGSDPNPGVTITLTDDRSAGVVGRIEDEAGHSLAGAQISVLGLPSIMTDEAGLFRFPPFTAPEAHVSVHVERVGYLPADLEVRAGSNLTPIRLRQASVNPTSHRVR